MGAANPEGQSSAAPGLLQNKKLLGIIGGAAAVIIIAVILLVTLGGGPKPVTASGNDFSGIWYNGTSDAYDTYEFFNKGKFTVTLSSGEIIEGRYTVSGEDVELVYHGLTDILTIEGNTMFGEYGVLMRELGDTAGYLGGYYYFYNEGNFDENIFLFLDSDGTFIAALTGEESTGTYVIEGEMIYLAFEDGSELPLFIQDENTLIEEETGATLMREDGAGSNKAKEIVLPAGAQLDTTVALSDLGMYVNYPSEVFTVAESGNYFVHLLSLDDKAGLEVVLVMPYDASNLTNDQVVEDFASTASRNVAERAVNGTDVEVTESHVERTGDGGVRYATGSATFTQNGVRMFTECYVGYWQKISDQSGYIYIVIVTAPFDSYDFYTDYLERINTGTQDM
jgi:hypothetical protein